jgi:hypothetical protein
MSSTAQAQGEQAARGGRRGDQSWSAVRQPGKSGQSESAQNQDENDEYGL